MRKIVHIARFDKYRSDRHWPMFNEIHSAISKNGGRSLTSWIDECANTAIICFEADAKAFAEIDKVLKEKGWAYT